MLFRLHNLCTLQRHVLLQRTFPIIEPSDAELFIDALAVVKFSQVHLTLPDVISTLLQNSQECRAISCMLLCMLPSKRKFRGIVVKRRRSIRSNFDEASTL